MEKFATNKSISGDLWNKTTFCALPWDHFHVDIDGKIPPCCMWSGVDSHDLTVLTNSTLNEAINGPAMQEVRKAMLNNEENRFCKSCYEVERINGFVSFRHKQNIERSNNSNIHEAIAHTNENGSIQEGYFKPSTLDLRFSNICNLKCRTCGPGASSKWNDEAVKLNKLLGKDNFVPASIIRNKQVDNVKPLLDSASFVYFAGGEPTVMAEHYEVLDYLINTGRAHDVALGYNINLTNSNYKDKNFIDYLKHFRGGFVFGSMDGKESIAEYIRTGSTWETMKETYNKLIEYDKQTPNFSAKIAFVVSVLNIHSIVDFFEYIIDQGWMIGDEPIRFGMLTHPYEYDIRKLPKSERIDISKKITQLCEHLSISYPDTSKHIIESILPFLNDDSIETDLEGIKLYLDANDVSSKTLNWKLQLPELKDMFDRYNITK